MSFLKELLVAASLFSLQVQAADSFELSNAVHENSTLKFKPHQGPGEYDSYLSMEIQYEPMADLFKQLLLDRRESLTNRGEAHITVVTPVEFYKRLRPLGIKIQQIDAIALEHRIQFSEFTPICLGRGQIKIGNNLEETYYVVVNSPDLLSIRKVVYELVLSKGGSKEDFDPDHFFPHITLGFTKRDLHESDGILKGPKTCWADLN